VLRSVALEHLRVVLGVDPREDAVIRFWAGLRSIALRTRCGYRMRVPAFGEPAVRVPLTGAERLALRYGRVNPAYAKARAGMREPPVYLDPKLDHRGHERREDEANALLVRSHPVLARDPLAFAALEAVFDLDACPDAEGQFVRQQSSFGDPAEWARNRGAAIERRDHMRRRASKLLARARALNEETGS